jgi:D-alanine transaminase
LVLRLTGSLGIPFQGVHVTLNELKAADELILVATTTEVVSVIELDGEPIGKGTPGPVALRLHRAYEAAVQNWLAGDPLPRPADAPVQGG